MRSDRKLKAGAVIGALGVLALTSHPAAAQEVTTYTYDAKGRVVTVQRTGGPNGSQQTTCNGTSINGACTTYTYDAADNRTNVTVNGSANGSSTDQNGGATAKTTSTTYVVVPLNGYSLIVVNQ